MSVASHELRRVMKKAGHVGYRQFGRLWGITLIEARCKFVFYP
jgi:hypothetical protein